MCVPDAGRLFARAGSDPLVRRHTLTVTLALHASGADVTEADVMHYFDPCALETFVHERLYGPTAELVLKYLRALSATQCRALARARNRLELELTT